MSSNWVRKSTKFSILARAAVSTPSGVVFRCAYCGETRPVHLITLDHVTSRRRGGSNKPSNLVACCSTCNSSKRDESLIAFATRLATEQAWSAAARTAPIGATCAEVDELAAELGRELAAEIVRRVRAEKSRKPLTAIGRQWAAMYRTAREAA